MQEIPKTPGVYFFENRLTNEKYIGVTKDLKRRFIEHDSKSRFKKGTSELYKAFRKYGKENFTFEIIEHLKDEYQLRIREIFWIQFYKPKYNSTLGGYGVKGIVVSEKTRYILKVKGKAQWERMSQENKSNQVRNNLTGPKPGYVMPEAQKQRLRELRAGTKSSTEAKAKISAANKISCKGNKNGNKAVISFKNGILIKEYISAVEAGLDIGIHPSGITGVLKGRKKTSGGFSWEYK